MAVVWVTHDLGVVARIVDQVVVMYAGRVVERAPTRQLFAQPGASVHAGPARIPAAQRAPGTANL